LCSIESVVTNQKKGKLKTMFILKSKAQLEKAIAKARKIRTQVKFISFGVYEVKGTKGNFYKVKCEKNAAGERTISCECLGSERGFVCYHSAAALALHTGLARQRQTA
jgi:uncharacterized Zn finger protein